MQRRAVLQERTIRARDGRRIEVAEFGDPDGRVVLHCHGGAESRRFCVEAEATATRGVRVVTMDRPGFGDSDDLARTTFTEWVDDVVDVMDDLGVDRFPVIGWSAGGPHALACAAALTERVTAVAAVASAAPVTALDGRHLGALEPVVAAVAAVGPTEAVPLIVEFAAPWVADPESFCDRANASPSSLRVLDHPDWGPNLYAQLRDGFRQGADGPAREFVLLATPWSFDLADVHVPVTVWAGEEDDTVPIGSSVVLAELLPHGSLRRVPGEGHFVIYPKWLEILDGLLATHTTRA